MRHRSSVRRLTFLMALLACIAVLSSCGDDEQQTSAGEVADDAESSDGDDEAVDVSATDTGTDGDETMADLVAELKSDPSGDADNDGISNAGEGLGDIDTDRDGQPDALDEDSDGDGVADAEEGQGDSDGDGDADFRDSDSDNDGYGDGEERPDQRRIPNHVSCSAENLQAVYLDCADDDDDGVPNYLDKCKKEKATIDINPRDGCDDEVSTGSEFALGCVAQSGVPTPNQEPDPTRANGGGVMVAGDQAACGVVGTDQLQGAVRDALDEWLDQNGAAIINVNGQDLLVLPADLAGQPGLGLPNEVLEAAEIDPSSVSEPAVVGSLPGVGRTDLIRGLVVEDPSAGVTAALAEPDLTPSNTAELFRDTDPEDLADALVEAEVVDETGRVDVAQMDTDDRLVVASTLDLDLTEALVSGNPVELPADDPTSQLVDQLLEGIDQEQSAQILDQVTSNFEPIQPDPTAEDPLETQPGTP